MIHLYKPLDWQARVGHRVSLALPSGKPQCRASVSEPRVGFHQCLRAGSVEVDGAWLCKLHSPEAEAARAAARAAKYAAEREKYSVQWRRDERSREALAALREIAAGHNDPRTLATELLTKYADLDT